MSEPDAADRLVQAIAACRLCRDAPQGAPLADPRPVPWFGPKARILVAGQAPGLRVHLSGKPFDDASGDRLRDWLGIDREMFYDRTRLAVVPMGFCFPGYDAKGADLPPRRECAPTWHERVMAALPRIDLVVAIGAHAQRHHFARLGLGAHLKPTLTATVEGWRDVLAARDAPRVIPLPHPSWRNTGWLKRRPWFEAELLPVLRAEVAARL